ncbi:MAG TPA: HepT-like ribonuclease domain-containing protein [Candidatus Hypogeohydataceae bacterium YC40]
MWKDKAILLDILKAGRLAIEFLDTMNKNAFMNDPKTQSSILHQLLILGEAVKRLSEDFREQHPEIPWKTMAGMRDKLIHAYNSVDFEEVWKTLTIDLPKIISLIEPLVPPEDKI